MNFPLLSSVSFHIPDVTQASVVQPVNLPPRPSQLFCQRVSPAHASPPTIASLLFVGLRSALAVGSWPVAKLWCSTRTVGGTWLLLHWTVPRPGTGSVDRTKLSHIHTQMKRKNKYTNIPTHDQQAH